uniref:Uncharacterized protein n=1 Tax=Brassica oleracea TaxID=3712 RepID=A0A3P6C612_BRAOL|nr:unnamed protein product [Brassica oleracea]
MISMSTHCMLTSTMGSADLQIPYMSSRTQLHICSLLVPFIHNLQFSQEPESMLNEETGHGEQNVKAKWIPTKVKVEEHVIVPHIDPNIENPDQFLEDYTTKMAISAMDKSKTLWEFHLLKLKTSHAGSVAVARFHNSLDKATPLKGKPGATVSINKFIHRIISLDDVKVVKNAMNMVRCLIVYFK